VLRGGKEMKIKMPKLGKSTMVRGFLRKKKSGGVTAVKHHFSHAKRKK
jgi:hypothetical protein